jgi:hypothetical protein
LHFILDVTVLAQDPNYTFSDPGAVAIDEEIPKKLHDGATWKATRDDIRRCRLMDPGNRLREVCEIVAAMSCLSVDDVYFTDVAKCGFRGAYRESGGATGGTY